MCVEVVVAAASAGLPPELKAGGLEVQQDQLVVMLRCSAQQKGQPGLPWLRWVQGWRRRRPTDGEGLEQLHQRSAMDRVRSAWTSQDLKPEEHAQNASESVMAVMN